MASLLRDISVNGVRKSDGSAAASAKIWCLTPGASSTSSTATVYSDKDGLAVLSQPITADAGGRAVIYVKSVVRLYIEDANGNILVQADRGDAISAAQVEIENAGFTGTILSGANVGSQAAGGRTDLSRVLDSAFASTNGPDFQFRESAGAIARTIRDKFAEQAISVKDFGAVGDGVNDDTTAVQAAVNRVSVFGGGTVLFPPGLTKNVFYRVTQPITLTSGIAVNFKGGGSGGSIVKNTGGATNCLTLTSCASFSIEGLAFSHTSTSTGTAIAMAACTDVVLRGLSTDSHQIGVDFSGACQNTLVDGCSINTTNNAASRGVRYAGTGLSFNHRIIGGSLNGSVSGKAVEYSGTASRAGISEALFSAATGAAVLFTAGLTGTRFVVHACPTIGSMSATNPFDLSALATDPLFEQFANNLDGYVVTQASGGGGGSSHTPDRSRGSEIHVRLTSGGAAVCTIGTPIPAPAATQRKIELLLRLTAAAGGAITWTLNSPYVLVGGGTTIAGADGTTIMLFLDWDPQTSRWREEWRSTTTT